MPLLQCVQACFEILGFDFILDEDERLAATVSTTNTFLTTTVRSSIAPWRLYLLEVNSAPSLSTPTALDEEIKSNMLGEDGLRLASNCK